MDWYYRYFSIFLLGEFSRAYEPVELAVILSRYQAFYSAGFVIGPATGILFEKVDIQLGGWILNKTNFIGIFIAILVSCFNVVVFFGVTNLSIDKPSRSFVNGSNSLATQANRSRYRSFQESVNLNQHIKNIDANESSDTDTSTLTKKSNNCSILETGEK